MCARPEFQYSFTAAFMSYTFCIFIICNQDFKAAVKQLSSPLWCLSIHLRRHQSPFVINAAQWRQHTEVIHWRSSSWVISDFNKHLGETSYHTTFKAQQLSHLNNLFDSTACRGTLPSLLSSTSLNFCSSMSVCYEQQEDYHSLWALISFPWGQTRFVCFF